MVEAAVNFVVLVVLAAGAFVAVVGTDRYRRPDPAPLVVLCPTCAAGPSTSGPDGARATHAPRCGQPCRCRVSKPNPDVTWWPRCHRCGGIR